MNLKIHMRLTAKRNMQVITISQALAHNHQERISLVHMQPQE